MKHIASMLQAQTATLHAVYGQKTTRTKGHHRRNFVVCFVGVYNDLCAFKNGEKLQ